MQAKLKIGQPNDIYEQEADSVAEMVMRMPGPRCPECLKKGREEELIQTKPNPLQITPLVQRQVEEEEEEEVLQAKEVAGQTPEVAPDIESNINALKGGGQPLPETVRTYFEPRFGYDFSKVRVHTDKSADNTSQKLNAQAFTVGQDMYFGAGKYSPETYEGRRLMAHELTHVVQQGGQSETFGSNTAIAPNDSPLEREANWVSDAEIHILESYFHEHLKIQQAAVPGLYRRRDPDIVHNGYHSFYIRAMLPGNRTEVRVQFFQDPSNEGSATFTVWYQETGTMQRISFTSDGAIRPIILEERVGIVTFDLNGDGVADIVLIARPNQQTVGVNFSATLNGSQFFTMAAVPPQRTSNYVPGRGIYMGQLPSGRPYYFTGTFDQRGPRYVDDTGQLVDPALEAQAAATMRAVGQGYLIGYGILLAIVGGYALVGVAEVGATGVGVAEVGIAAARQGLIAALRHAGVKFTEQAIVGITRTVVGRIVWLETGSVGAGLTHIMNRHGSQFAAWGLRSSQQVGQFLIDTVRTLTPVATQPGGAFDFAVRVGGAERLLRIVIASNGFIVTAHPL